MTNAKLRQYIRFPTWWPKRFHLMSDSAIRVLFVLLSHRNNKTGVAWPHEKRLALECRCDARSIRRAVVELKAAGYIETRRDETKSGRPNVYSFATGEHPFNAGPLFEATESTPDYRTPVSGSQRNGRQVAMRL